MASALSRIDRKLLLTMGAAGATLAITWRLTSYALDRLLERKPEAKADAPPAAGSRAETTRIASPPRMVRGSREGLVSLIRGGVDGSPRPPLNANCHARIRGASAAKTATPDR